jgi:hypothetical protein
VLLEMILFQLPMKDLLFAQKVSRTWQAVIQISTKLQKRLFFRPMVPRDATFCELSGHTSTLTQHLTLTQVRRPSGRLPSWPLGNANPLLFKVLPYPDLTTGVATKITAISLLKPRFNFLRSPPEASW